MDSEETAIEGNPVEGEGQRGQGSLFWQSSSSSLSDGFEVPEFLACPKDDSSTIPTATESFMVIGDTVLDGSDDEDSAGEASMIKEDATFDGSFSLLESLDQDDDASVQSEVEQFTGHLSKQLIDVGSREIVGSESREIIGSGTKGIIGSVVNLEESLIDGSSSGDTEELIVGSDELVDTVSSHQSLDPLSVFAIEQESSKKLITPENIHTNSNIPDEISLTPKLFQPQEPQIRSKKRPQTTVSNIPKEVFKTAATSKQRIFKVIIVGDTNVGKTCLAVRFCSGSFPEKVEATIGVDFREKSIEIAGDTIKLQLWDTAGQERFRKSMVPHYYRNANAIVFVYDVTKQSSFGSLPSWIQECDEYNLGKDVPRILIGNKCDLYDQIVVGTSLAQQFADLHHMPLFETSAKTNSDSDNVESIFLTLAYKLKCCRPWMQVPRNCGYMYSSRSTVFLSLDAPNRQENDANFCVCFK